MTEKRKKERKVVEVEELDIQPLFDEDLVAVLGGLTQSNTSCTGSGSGGCTCSGYVAKST